MADFGPVPSGLFGDPRMRRAEPDEMGWMAILFGLASPMGRTTGDPFELAHQARCMNVPAIERFMVSLARRRMIRVYVADGDGGLPVAVAEIIGYHAFPGMPDGRRHPSLVLQATERWPEPDASHGAEALGGFYDSGPEALPALFGRPEDSVTRSMLEARVAENKGGGSPPGKGGGSPKGSSKGSTTESQAQAKLDLTPAEEVASSVHGVGQDDSKDAPTDAEEVPKDVRREAQDPSKDGPRVVKVPSKDPQTGVQAPPKTPQRPVQDLANDPQTPEREKEREGEEEGEEEPEERAPGPNAHAPAREPARGGPPSGGAAPPTPTPTSAPAPAPEAESACQPSLADAERDLRQRPSVPDWPSEAHAEAARRWYARLDALSPTGHGVDPHELRRLADAHADVFVAAVDRMLGSDKGWRAGSAVRFLLGSFSIVREDLAARRADRVRGQGLTRLDPGAVVSSLSPGATRVEAPSAAQPAAGGWEAPIDDAWTAVSRALSQPAQRAPQARAAAAQFAAARAAGAPATELAALDGAVAAVSRPPVPPDVWGRVEQAWAERASAYDRRTWLVPLAPIAFDGRTLFVSAPDESHAEHVRESGWVDGHGFEVRFVCYLPAMEAAA